MSAAEKRAEVAKLREQGASRAPDEWTDLREKLLDLADQILDRIEAEEVRAPTPTPGAGE